MKFNEWWQEDYERKRRLAGRLLWVQVGGTLLIIVAQLICNLTGITPYPWALLWILAVVLWNVGFVLWAWKRS